MFTADTSITDLKSRAKDIFKVLFSMNQHQVATPDLSVEDARSYVFFFRDNGKVSVFIGLYFIRTGARFYYTHSSNPFSESEQPGIENEARSFTEDLGALLDELDFSKLSLDEKNHWFDEQELITGGKKEDLPEETAASQESPAEQPEPVQQPSAAEKASGGAGASANPSVIQFEGEPEPPASAAPVVPSAIPVPETAVPVQQVFVTPPATPVPETAVPVQQAPVVPSGMPAQPVAPAQSEPAGPSQPSPAQRPVLAPKKTAPHAPVAPPASGTGSEQQEPAFVQSIPEDVLEAAVKAGVVKAPKAQLKKDIRTATGVVTRDKEALARLLASF